MSFTASRYTFAWSFSHEKQFERLLYLIEAAWRKTHRLVIEHGNTQKDRTVRAESTHELLQSRCFVTDAIRAQSQAAFASTSAVS